jgi:hypothetical protein
MCSMRPAAERMYRLNSETLLIGGSGPARRWLHIVVHNPPGLLAHTAQGQPDASVDEDVAPPTRQVGNPSHDTDAWHGWYPAARYFFRYSSSTSLETNTRSPALPSHPQHRGTLSPQPRSSAVHPPRQAGTEALPCGANAAGCFDFWSQARRPGGSQAHAKRLRAQS